MAGVSISKGNFTIMLTKIKERNSAFSNTKRNYNGNLK